MAFQMFRGPRGTTRLKSVSETDKNNSHIVTTFIYTNEMAPNLSLMRTATLWPDDFLQQEVYFYLPMNME